MCVADQILRQPDGRFAIFNTIVDGFTLVDATKADLLEHYVEKSRKDCASFLDKTCGQLERGGKPYHQFTMNWNEAAREHNRNFPEDAVALDPPSQDPVTHG